MKPITLERISKPHSCYGRLQSPLTLSLVQNVLNGPSRAASGHFVPHPRQCSFGTASLRKRVLRYALLLIATVALKSFGASPREQFFDALREGNRDSAAKLAKYFEKKGSEFAPEVWAQYHLLMCQHTSLSKQTAFIQNANLQNLFLAVQSATLAIRRVTPLDQIKPPGDKKTVARQTLNFPIVDAEVWADEWDDLRVFNVCRNAPVSQTEKNREIHEKRALEIFGALPPKAFLSDFSVVALALDVGHIPQNAPEVLEVFNAEKDSPYYVRLTELTGHPQKTDSLKAEQKEAEVSLTTLTLSIKDLAPRALKTPYLLEARFE